MQYWQIAPNNNAEHLFSRRPNGRNAAIQSGKVFNPTSMIFIIILHSIYYFLANSFFNNSFTNAGLALPFVSFIICPTRNPSA